MDAGAIRSREPLLRDYLRRFDEWSCRSEPRGHLGVVIQGRLSDLPRENGEPIADAADMPARTRQHFFSLFEVGPRPDARHGPEAGGGGARRPTFQLPD